MANRNPSFAKMHHCVHKARVWAEGCDVALAAVLSGGGSAAARAQPAPRSPTPAALPTPVRVAPSQTPAVARLLVSPHAPPTHPPTCPRTRTHPPPRAAAARPHPALPSPDQVVCALFASLPRFLPSIPVTRLAAPTPSIDRPPPPSQQPTALPGGVSAGTRVSVFTGRARVPAARDRSSPERAQPKPPAAAPRDRVWAGMAGRGERTHLNPD